jgi:hypothetical protein
MHPALTSTGRGFRLSIMLAAAGLLAACTVGQPPDPAEQSSEPRPSPTAADVGATLCDDVDVEIVQSVVGVRDVPDPPATAENTGSGWSCSWQGDPRSTGPNGQVAQPSVYVMLYDVPLEITTGGEEPTTVAGRPGTVARKPGLCAIRVRGTGTTLAVDTASADPRRDPCPAATSIAEPLVERFVD